MADEWGDILFDPISFGGIELDVISVSDNVGRVLARHEYPFRDGAVIEDMGGVPRETGCDIIFIPGGAGDGANHLENLVSFLDVAQSGEASTFIHPLTGSYQAFVEDLTFNARADDRSVVRVSCTFVEAGLDRAAFFAGADESVGSGVVLAEEAQADMNASIEADADAMSLDPPITVQDDVVATATSWQDTPNITPRQINLELNSVTKDIITQSERLELASDVTKYPLYQSFQRLHRAIRRAAEIAIRTGPKLTELTVGKDMPLLAVMSNFYGGTLALSQYTKTRELNDIDNPALVPEGTKLTVEQR